MSILLTHFRWSDFDSPGEPGSGSNMQISTLELLEKARGLAGIPFIVTSGFRSEAHNAELEHSVQGSAHTKGHAIDVSCRTSQQRYKIVKALFEVGFNRIGIGKTFIHFDNDPDKPANCIWVY